MARILIASDAWHPQMNGVVRTLDTTVRILREQGHDLEIIEPSAFPNRPLPFYPEIRLSFPLPHRVAVRIKRFQPDFVHLSTEGPIGLSVRRFCRQRGYRFTTSYHTKFPEYLHTLTGFPERWAYWYLKWFHGGAAATMIATPSLEADLMQRGFPCRFRRWSRGVDLDLFHPRPKRETFPRPIMLYVGRVSTEKNLEAFLSRDLPGTKVIVGDGPARSAYQSRFPNVVFRGVLKGSALAEEYANADLFVFPSRTDTFGIVLIEALASGLPVAAYPVTGPVDVVTRPELGAVHEDLVEAIRLARETGRPEACIAEAQSYTWGRSTMQFLSNLVPVVPARNRGEMS
ncbi:MAG: glycosyltransferase family 1 protein [Gemmataceae bacterium]